MKYILLILALGGITCTTNQVIKEYTQYKQEMSCVSNLVSKGIPRNQITHNQGTCHVKK